MNRRAAHKGLERLPRDERQKVGDLSHYDLMDHFTARQAACLIAGIDPNLQDLANLYGTADVARMRTIEDAMEQAFGYAQAAVTKDLEDHPPGFGFEYPAEPPWLRKPICGGGHEIMLPSMDLLDLWKGWPSGRINADPSVFDRQTFRREDIAVWLKHKGFDGARYFLSDSVRADGGDDSAGHQGLQAKGQQLQDDKPGTRVRETLYKIIIGMAIRGYRYDPSTKRGTAVPEIVNDLEALGVAVSDDTVRKHLKAAAQLLPPKTS